MIDGRMRYFNNLHPAVSMCYFVCVLTLTLLCKHPIIVLLSALGAAFFSFRLRGKQEFCASMRFVLPMFILISIGNPLFNHRGVTFLFMFMDQWITLEAVVYGLVSACSLSAIVLWFTCYQEVMTSDKFLYLFGKIAPATSLLITTTLRFIPLLQRHASEIMLSQKMIRGEDTRLTHKIASALRNLSALLTMSMEGAVETVDSMKARGFGVKRRTTFHLFHFDFRDAATLGLILSLFVVCLVARAYGHGFMEYYPRMTPLTLGTPSITMFVLTGMLMFLPSVLEMKEAILWKSYGLTD